MKKHNAKVLSSRLLCLVLLLVFVLGFANPVTPVKAAEPTVELSSTNPNENQIFEISNMVPGALYTKTFRVALANGEKKNLGFRAFVASGDQKLADALQMKVNLPELNAILYEGPVKDMDWKKFAPGTIQEVAYEITFSIDKNLGNEYQNMKINLNLEWMLGQPGIGGFWLWFAIIGGAVVVIAAVVVAIILIRKKKRMKGATRTVGNLILAMALVIGLGATTVAIAANQVTLGNNIFQTGVLKVTLNDDKPVFDQDILLEPGMMVQQKFTISNEGSVDAYYRLWFDEIDGDLAEELEIEIKEGKRRIFEGSFEDIMEETETVYANTSTLNANETKEMTIIILLPEEAKNNMQGKTVSFRLNFDATQKDGNISKEFE